MKRKFAPWYTVERWQKPTEEDAAFYEQEFGHKPYKLIYKSVDGTLFSKGRYPTKIKADDLPSSFMHARIGKLFGSYDASAVTGVAYNPSEWINHLFRDDCLCLSFSNECVDPNNWDSFDIVLQAWRIVEGLAALDVYSSIPGDFIDELENEVAAKVRLYGKTHPNEQDCISEEDYWERLKEAKRRIKGHLDS